MQYAPTYRVIDGNEMNGRATVPRHARRLAHEGKMEEAQSITPGLLRRLDALCPMRCSDRSTYEFVK